MNETISKYDRLYGSLMDVSIYTKASTIKTVQAITGKTESFIIQTCRHEDNGDYIFIECLDENGVIRLALPPQGGQPHCLAARGTHQAAEIDR